MADYKETGVVFMRERVGRAGTGYRAPLSAAAYLHPGHPQGLRLVGKAMASDHLHGVYRIVMKVVFIDSIDREISPTVAYLPPYWEDLGGLRGRQVASLRGGRVSRTPRELSGMYVRVATFAGLGAGRRYCSARFPWCDGSRSVVLEPSWC